MSKQATFDEKIDTKKSTTAGSSSSQSPLLSILCYCGASIVMTIVNKFIVSGSSFNMTFLLLAIQSIVCVVCVESVKKAGIITFRDFDMQDAKAWFPISFLLVLVIYSGSKSLQYLTIPLYTIFKNLTIILIAYGEVIWFGGKVTGLTLVSFFLMVFSSVVAAVTDVKGAKDVAEILPPASTAIGLGLGLEMMSGVVKQLNVGYMWMTLNCLASAAYVLAMRIRIKVTGFSDWDSMYYNNLLTIPVLVIFSLLTESWTSTNLALNFPAETRSFLLFTIAFSGAAAVAISYSTAWCVRTTSSTTYSMVGALNKLPVAVSGMLFFGDIVTFGSVTAIGLGCMSGVIYALAKNNQKKADARAQSKTSLPMHNRQS